MKENYSAEQKKHGKKNYKMNIDIFVYLFQY